MEAQCALYSQWIPGDENDVADCLSRDHHLTTASLNDDLPASQVPPFFSICPVPPALASQQTQWLQELPKATQMPKGTT